ncbi:MAG: response regulator [Bdellovibrionota bacterium]
MSSSTRGCIFVIEDSEDIRDLIKLLYESEGYPVEFAGDGKEALEKLRSFAPPPCVILLDLMMPGMDGYQFRAEQIKDSKMAAIPTLVMTADSNAEEKAKRVGASGFLRKPVNIDVLIKVAEKYCV